MRIFNLLLRKHSRMKSPVACIHGEPQSFSLSSRHPDALRDAGRNYASKDLATLIFFLHVVVDANQHVIQLLRYKNPQGTAFCRDAFANSGHRDIVLFWVPVRMLVKTSQPEGQVPRLGLRHCKFNVRSGRSGIASGSAYSAARRILAFATGVSQNPKPEDEPG